MVVGTFTGMSELSAVTFDVGPTHNIVLGNDMNAYSFGDGDYGRLGHGNHTGSLDESKPKKLESFDGYSDRKSVV